MRGLRTDCAATRVVALSAALATAGVVHGQINPWYETFYVDDDAPAGGDGLSWVTAFNDLSDALEAASGVSQPTVFVAGGVYFPGRGTADRHAAFSVDRAHDAGQTLSAFIFHIRGGFAGLANPSEPNLHDPGTFTTVLSGDYAQDDTNDLIRRTENTERVVLVGSGFDLVWFEDLVIEGGYDPRIQSNGAGMYVAGTPSVRAERVVFRNNVAGRGGALSGSAQAHRYMECRFEGNAAVYSGGAVGDLYGAVLANCVFVGNNAAFGGAASGSSDFNGCVFVGNSATEHGGAVSLDAFRSLRNCTIVGNHAGGFGGGLYVTTLGTWRASAVNSIFWGNTDATGQNARAQAWSVEGLPWIEYSVVQGAIADGLIVADDPLFVDPVGNDGVAWSGDEDLALMPGSPAIDAGSNAGMADSLDLVMGLLEQPGLYSSYPVDIGGGFRLIGASVDMGAFENQNSTAACSIADVTTAGSPWPGIPDGRVTGGDLTYFVNTWVDRRRPADVTTINAGAGDAGYGVPDGRVTAIDLSYFVNAWLEGCE